MVACSTRFHLELQKSDAHARHSRTRHATPNAGLGGRPVLGVKDELLSVDIAIRDHVDQCEVCSAADTLPGRPNPTPVAAPNFT